MAVAIVALCVIIPWSWDATRETWYAAYRVFTRWQDAQPPRQLPERKGDRERYRRSGFGLILESTRGLGVDTFAGTATKDMIGLPDTTIAMRLSDAQLDTLYDMVIHIRLFDNPGPMPQLASNHGFGYESRLTVRAGSSTRVFTWSHDYFWPIYRPHPLPDDWKRFSALLDTIGRMVRTHPAYAALPPPKGIYID